MVGFLFLNTRVKGIPIPLHRNFEEVNLRFYVRTRREAGWERGVVFVKEIVPLPAVALTARWVYGENYIALPMRHQIKNQGDGIQASYGWRFHGKWNLLSARAQGQAQPIVPGSTEEFITEHYWGYARQRDGGTVAYRVEHSRWQVWRAETCRLDCDAQSLYGPRFAESLAQPPVSAFIAVGSETKVMEGKKAH